MNKSNTSLSRKLALASGLSSQLQKLQADIAAEQTAALRALPAQNGFTDLNEFIKALRAAHNGNTRKTSKTRKARKSAPRKARTSITPEKRDAIVADLKGGMASLDAANKHGISIATVQNIKKAAGLVKARV